MDEVITQTIRPDGTIDFTIAGTDRGRVKQELWHNTNGPARIFSNGDLEYRQYGYLHRLDGPAVIGGRHHWKYWIDGNFYHFDDFCKVTNKTNEEKVILKLTYGGD